MLIERLSVRLIRQISGGRFPTKVITFEGEVHSHRANTCNNLLFDIMNAV